MKLYLVRHGESISLDQDGKQPLSEMGKRQTEQVANYLKGTNIHLDALEHSVKLRAKQTAEILAKALAPHLSLTEREGLKPMDPIEPLIDYIQLCTQNLMLVGHLPFMEKLLTQLVLKRETLSPVILCGSSVICLEGMKKEWCISWVVSPRLLVKSTSKQLA